MNWRYALTLLLALALTAPAIAQEKDEKARDQLEGARRQLEQSEKRKDAITKELTGLEKEAEEISARLIALSTRTRKGEAALTATENKISRLDLEEKALTIALADGRNQLSHLLVGLQRLGRDRPPPLAAHPRDALAAVRSATLFGAIIPAIKQKTSAIRHDLAKLEQVRARLKTAKKDLERDGKTLDGVQAELAEALKRKRNFVNKSRAELDAEKKRTAALVARVRNLSQLLAELKKQREEAARKKAAADAKAQKQAEAKRRAEALRPKIVFTKSTGKLDLPAEGDRVLTFGQRDKLGGRATGLSIATRKGARVTAPTDGVVEFAGEFRSYGQLVILNVGEGYHILFGGLAKLDVTTGQRLRKGEPVGQMGNNPARGTLITATLDEIRPVLYIEFRKKSEPVDPSPWWRSRQQKAQN